MWLTSLRSPDVSQSKKYSQRTLFWMLGILIVLLVVHIGLQYLNLEVYNEKNGAVYELANRFDFDDESSVMTWISQFQLIALSGICLLAAVLEKQKTLKKLWLIPSVLGLLFSIDETATLHEFILQRIHVAFFGDAKPTLMMNAWVIILPFIALFAGLMAWKMFKQLPRVTVGLICLGGAIFLGGAVFVDLITNGLPETPFVAQGILVALEESSELLGVSIVIYAVASYIEQTYGHAVGRAIRQLKG